MNFIAPLHACVWSYNQILQYNTCALKRMMHSKRQQLDGAAVQSSRSSLTEGRRFARRLNSGSGVA